MVDGNDSRSPSVAESIAESIAEGQPVDWHRAEEESTGEQETGVLQELHLLDRIASFHRRPDPHPTTPLPESEPPAMARDELRTWGHMTILEKIGEGVFGVVYRARDDKLQSEVALKLLWPGNRDALKEARHLARVRHPNVVTVHGADLIDGRVGLWMEFVKGRTLADILGTHGPFSAREAAGVGLDLCRALAAVHGAGLLHGDVKVHNVMREERGRTVLMDFGAGKDLDKDRTQRPRRPTDDFAGTPLYLPPEVFDGRKRTKGTDIYCLGVLLFHLVTEAYPVEGRTREEVERAHQRQERKHLRDLRPDLPEEFVQAVERALAAAPESRYQSAGAFEAALARFLGAAPDAGPKPSPWPRRLAVAVGALAVAAAVTVGYRVVGPGSQPSDTAGTEVALPPATGAVATSPARDSGSYRIDTALYRETDDRQEVRLRSGARVAPGDRLFVEIRASVPTYVYIVNEDERGNSYLLFPLPGQNATNPLPAEQTTRLPGARGTEELYWQVDQAGGREHFLIFASPAPLSTLEQMFAALPRPQAGRPIQNAARLSGEAVGQLRSVGGLAPAPGSDRPGGGALSQQYATPLGDVEETARGLWVRQLTLDNPTK